MLSGIAKMPERTKLLLLSLVVGLCSGLAAVLLNWLISKISSILASGHAAGYHWMYLALPGIGMLLSMLAVKYIVRDNIGHGVTKVLVAVSKDESKIKPHNMWSSMLTSALTIGFGGSVGAEAPIVYTGAAIGSNFGRHFGLSYKNITVLLGCGAAGAIAGIFKAPLAGVLFTMEILLFNISMSSMLPLLISTVSATVVAYVFNGQTSPFQCSLTPFSMVNIPFYVILGIACGIGSLYFLRMTLFLEDKISHKLPNAFVRWLVCATLLGLLIFLFPMLYGEGYGSLDGLLNNAVSTGDTPLSFLGGHMWSIPLFFALVFLFKVFAMTFTNAGGGVGGTFGPTLFEGAILGFIVARTLNIFMIGTGAGFSVPEQNFVLVGMAGLMAGVMQAPMTAIFLIAEMTGGYDLFLPLILTSAVSFGTMRIFEKYSIYSKRIANTGELLTHDSDKSVLTLLKTADLVRDKYPRIDVSSTLKEIIPVVSESAVAVFPVLDANGRFCGMLEMDDIRKHFFRKKSVDTLYVRDIMTEAPAFVNENDPMEEVMDKFDQTDAWRLPVVDDDRKYLGFISKSRILMAYRAEMKVISED